MKARNGGPAAKRLLPKKDVWITLACCGVLLLSALFFAYSLRSASRVSSAQSYLAGRADAQVSLAVTPETAPEACGEGSVLPQARAVPVPEQPETRVPVAVPDETERMPEETPEETDAEYPEQAPEQPLTLAAAEPDQPLSAEAGDPAPPVSAPKAPVDRTQMIVPNWPCTDSLNSARDTVSYEFVLTERGAVRYSFGSSAESAGEWVVRLYQEYEVNGNGGEKALRLLNTLRATEEHSLFVSPNLGLTRGRYILRVSAGTPFSAATYSLELSFTAGTQYEIEYNDTRTRYTEIYTGSSVSGSASFYEQGFDVDWYLLRTYTAGALELTFAHENRELSTVAFRVDLYNENMEPLYSGNSLLQSESISSGAIGLPAGVYYISVQGRIYVDCDYTLSVRSLGGGYEAEPNDNARTATPVVSGRDVMGALSARVSAADRDYYSFTLPERGYVSLTMKNVKPAAEGKDYVRRLTLFAPDGTEVYSAMIAGGENAVLLSPDVGLPAGDYLLRVDDDNLYHNSDTYSLRFTFTPEESWEPEPNDTPETATPLLPLSPVTGTLSDALTDFDTDWFVLTVEEGDSLLLRFTHGDTGDERDIFNVRLYNADLQPVGETVVSCGNTPEISRTYPVLPGIWYVRVTSGKYASDIRYELTYSMEK